MPPPPAHRGVDNDVLPPGVLAWQGNCQACCLCLMSSRPRSSRIVWTGSCATDSRRGEARYQLGELCAYPPAREYQSRHRLGGSTGEPLTGPDDAAGWASVLTAASHVLPAQRRRRAHDTHSPHGGCTARHPLCRPVLLQGGACREYWQVTQGMQHVMGVERRPTGIFTTLFELRRTPTFTAELHAYVHGVGEASGCKVG